MQISSFCTYHQTVRVGSCFPKDTRALVKIGEKYGYDLKIVKSAIEVNEAQRILPLSILTDQYNDIKNKVITILGLAFKPDTDDIREAHAHDIYYYAIGRRTPYKQIQNT